MAIKWGALAFIARSFFLAVEVLAGKETSANIVMKLFTDIRVSEALAYILAGGSVAYGLAQRGLRRKTVSRLHGHTHEVEKRLDPGRTSSKLTSRGETRPEDRL